MTKTQLQVNFRMPAELKARLEEAAAQSGRTLTAEIVQRLGESFASGPRLQSATEQLEEMVAGFRDVVAKLGNMPTPEQVKVVKDFAEERAAAAKRTASTTGRTPKV